MWKITSKNKENTNKAKEFILKEFFNSSKQKKVVTRAAKESAEDQKILITKYNQLVNQ